MLSASLLSKVKSFPNVSGVYLMRERGASGAVIYVGKAKYLRRRVRSYFKAEKNLNSKTAFLMNRVGDIEFVVTANEKEALLLENTLIKKYLPRYNIHLRDDKNYASIRFSTGDAFPQISMVRQRIKTDAKALYLGPYTSAVEARTALKRVQELFGIRTCSKGFFNSRTRPCIDYDMSLCSGPCTREIDEVHYQKEVAAAIDYLKGYRQTTLRRLQEEMKAAASAMAFEKATLLRNRIRTIEQSFDQQSVILARAVDWDIIYLLTSEQRAFIVLLQVREGKLIGTQKFSFIDILSNPGESLLTFMQQYYGRQLDWPSEVIISEPVKEIATLNELVDVENPALIALKTVFVVPAYRGEKKRLLQLAGQNAHTFAEDFERKRTSEEKSLVDVQSIFHLAKIPRTIECFDISNMGGEYAVGSKVSFVDGKPEKARYRRYKIRTVEGANDFAMMMEVLYRRFSKLSEDPLPDLVLIDGGKGQLKVAADVLFGELHLEKCFLASLAKERRKEGEKIALERFFIPGRKNPIIVPDHRPGRLLLIRIRDEAHRFAISYYRKRHRKEMLLS